ncbi:MAG TPA: MarR family transcriptional regulator [Bryobacteraceae bacterium]|nr:MarR family transcriptional regulator [Bryobacteraceae bacterium]
MAHETGVHLWLILMKAHEALRQHAIRHVQTLGIGFSDFAVLEVLLHKGPTPVNEIGRRVRLTSGSITAAVDRLERKGLVERHGDPADRRTRMVHLTAAGRQLISTAFAEHSLAMERATAGLTPEERAEAAALLKKLGRSAEASLEE